MRHPSTRFLCSICFVAAWLTVSAAPAAETALPQEDLRRFVEIFNHVRAHHVTPPEPQVLLRAATRGLARLAPTPIDLSTLPAAKTSVNTDHIAPEIVAAVKAYGTVYEEVRRQANSPSPERLLRAGIDGLLSVLDERSIYIDPETAKELRSGPSPTVGVVGVTLQKRGDDIFILGSLEGSPGETLALQADDRLLEIEGASVKGASLNDVVRLLRGPPGSKVNMTFERKGQEYRGIVRRSVVTYSTVDSALYPGNLAYVRVANFAQTTPQLLARHLAGIRIATFPNLRGIVVDLRNNGGGLLNSAIGATDLFLDRGLILTTVARNPDGNYRFVATAQKDDLKATIPMVVLVNGNTAAGAESFAAALQDHKRATVLGSSTLVAGSVQTLFPLTGGALLKLTTARLHRPNGAPLEQTGVVPDVCLRGDALLYLGPARARTVADAKRLCPPDTRSHDNEHDDVALQAALDMLAEKKRLAWARGR